MRTWFVCFYTFLSILLFPLQSQCEPKPSDVPLNGLQHKTQVIRDANGIAHIYANNEHDLFFMQGYIHAEDRLFQMDMERRQASGTLAELFGPQVLNSDVIFRTLGLRRAAQRSLAVYSQRAMNAMQAYTDGINTYIEQHPLPPDYAALEITHKPQWSTLDVAVVAKLLAFGLSFDMLDIDRTVALRSYEVAGQQLGFDGTALYFEDLFRSQPFDLIATVPQALQQTNTSDHHARQFHKPLHIDAVSADLCRKASRKMHDVPYLQQLVNGDKPKGSNEWAISGRFTKSGMPLLANDPHLALTIPSTFYPIHLKAGKIDAIGSGFAGVPSVIVGKNRHITWGTTFNDFDAVDYYQEKVVPDSNSPSGLSTLYQGNLEPIIPIPEVFRANQVGDGINDDVVVVPPGNGIPAATLIVPRRNQGPILELDQQSGAALSVQYTGFSGTREIDTFLMLDSARNLKDFITSLQYFDVGSENFAYADDKGNIAYFTSAEIPLREDLQAGTVNGLPPFFIRNGQGGNEWLPVKNPLPGQAIPYEILPPKEMPHIVNPPRGWFVNANNDPAGVTLDNDPLNQFRPDGGIYYLHNTFQSAFRAARISQLIRQKLEIEQDYLSLKDLQNIQADTVSRDAQVLTPYIAQAFTRAQQPGANPLLAQFAANAQVVEAVQRLQHWDHSTPTGIAQGYDASDRNGVLSEPNNGEIKSSIAATIYNLWRSNFIRNVIDNKAKPYGLPVPDSRQTLAAIRHLLDNFDTGQGVGASGIDFFALPGVDNANDRRDILILQSLADSLTALAGDAFAPAFQYSTDQNNYRWGLLHRIVFAHPLGAPFSIPPEGGVFPQPLEGLPGIPTDGDFQTIDAADHDIRADSVNGFMFTYGPVDRFVASVDRYGNITAESIWPGGSSGVLGSPNYANMLPLWLTNDTVPLLTDKRDVQEEAQQQTVFVPSRRP